MILVAEIKQPPRWKRAEHRIRNSFSHVFLVDASMRSSTTTNTGEREFLFYSILETVVEDQANYITDANAMMGTGYDDQPAAVIDPPRMVTALRESGLTEYRVWGWVKKSAKFIHHIGVLKGSKISTWDVIALSINEDGECNLSAPEIAKLTRYSVSETRQAIGELEEMGYLSVQRNSGKRSIYKPLYAARGANTPIEPDPSSYSTPLVGKDKRAADPSSPAIGNSLSSIKELKELNVNERDALLTKL